MCWLVGDHFQKSQWLRHQDRSFFVEIKTYFPCFRHLPSWRENDFEWLKRKGATRSRASPCRHWGIGQAGGEAQKLTNTNENIDTSKIQIQQEKLKIFSSRILMICDKIYNRKKYKIHCTPFNIICQHLSEPKGFDWPQLFQSFRLLGKVKDPSITPLS